MNAPRRECGPHEPRTGPATVAGASLDDCEVYTFWVDPSWASGCR
jgi:hypothetical protein